MTKLRCLLGLAIGCAAACASVAADGGAGELKHKERRAYVRAGIGFPVYRYVGAPHFHAHTQFRISGNVAVGLKINPKFAVELEGMYFRLPSVESGVGAFAADKSKMKYSSWVWFANALFNLPKFQKIIPYIGAGVGYAKNKTSNITTDAGAVFWRGLTEKQIAGQIILGTNYAINEHLDFTVDARYIYLNKFSNLERIGNKLSGHLQILTVTTGIKYNF